MENFTAFLAFVSIVCLVFGLIKPSIFKSLFNQNTNRKFISVFFGGITIMALYIFGKVSTQYSNNNSDKKNGLPMDQYESGLGSASLEDKITNFVKGILSGNNSNEEPYFRDINLSVDKSEVAVVIHYNENINPSFTITSIKSKMSDLYLKLYKSKFPIKSISISAYLPLVDKYGHRSNDMVCKTFLDKTEASKINWYADEAEIKYMILPNVWTIKYLHPIFMDDLN